MRILLTTTSFQDTPGNHHTLLKDTGYKIDVLRGPVSEDILLPIIGNYDGVICGDDEFSYKVIEKGKDGQLKVISKYGVGLDMVDIEAADKFEIPVFNTPGVNQITVAEHAISLMLTYLKNIHLEYNITRKGGWKRLVGNEIFGKKVGILGLGRIGKELVKRLIVFGVNIYAYDIIFDEDFINEYSIIKVDSIENLVLESDILSIHMPLTSISKHAINMEMIKKISNPLIIVNTSRANIIDQKALIFGLDTNVIKAYLTDVMDGEPMRENHALKEYDNVIITPHIGSRTHESVVRQGTMAVNNLYNFLVEKYD